MDKLNILVVGVGGQGVVTLARLLSEAAYECSLNVLMSETRGLSRRGGSVKVFLRIGKVYAPTFNNADLLIGLELLETLRNISYVTNETVIVVNNKLLLPSNVKYVIDEERVFETLRLRAKKLEIVDAENIALKLGNIKSENMVMLGYISSHSLLKNIRHCIEKAFYRSKYSKIRENIEAFEQGKQLKPV